MNRNLGPAPQRPWWSRLLRLLGTPVRWLFVAAIGVYRKYISPMFGPSCRYHPSCSAYAEQAIGIHGAGKGLVLASWRLARCNPLTKGGVDPVPQPGRWLPDVLPNGKPRPGRPTGVDTKEPDSGYPDSHRHPGSGAGTVQFCPDHAGSQRSQSAQGA